MNEANTRAKLIDPKLKSAGWSEELIDREFPISAGQIEVIGEIHRRARIKSHTIREVAVLEPAAAG